MSKVIISGGGTGGHIFPAIAIANALTRLAAEVEILFVGAEGKMEMEKIPAAGYRIEGLPIEGLLRRFTLKNLSLPFKLIKCLNKSKEIIRRFKPDAVVGVGGYASAPVLWKAQRMGIPTLIQEQNSYAGLANKILGKRASRVCTAYEGMERFFPAGKILLTGNPVRGDLSNINTLRKEAAAFFGINPAQHTLLVTGGSLGARTLNESVEDGLPALNNAEVQVVWQTGKAYFERARNAAARYSNIKVFEFVHRMDYAFAVADTIVSRAGAGTVSELCIVGKPVILVPSPNVAEDHQTVNAKTLVRKHAALMITDADARRILIHEALRLLNNEDVRETLGTNINRYAMPHAAETIAQEIIKLFNAGKV